MPLALQPATEVTLRFGPHAVALRASLRVAVALESLPGGIAALWQRVALQRLTALHAVIRAAASDQAEADRLLAHAATQPLAPFLGPAQAACLALLASIFGPAQGGASSQDLMKGPMPLARFFTELFSRATSWLHWPPSEVWNASVGEIITALEAESDRELRRAGLTEDDPAKEAQRQANIEAGLDPDFDRAGLQALKQRFGA